MIHKEGPKFLNLPRHSAPHARLLDRRALLAGPAAVLCTKVLYAAAAEPRSFVDVVPAQWTRIVIEVSGSRAELSVDEAAQPVLIVTDLKRGAQARGTVGFYVDNGTDGHLCNLRITPR
jgi:hypothetical protein